MMKLRSNFKKAENKCKEYTHVLNCQDMSRETDQSKKLFKKLTITALSNWFFRTDLINYSTDNKMCC